MLSSGNWNAICHEGVVGSALTIERDHYLVARMLMFMKRYLPIYLSGYGNDGGCSEGPAYWQLGFGWLCALNEQLEIRTNGKLSRSHRGRRRRSARWPATARAHRCAISIS